MNGNQSQVKCEEKQPEKIVGKKQKDRIPKELKFKKWTLDEQEKYISFVKDHKKHFYNEFNRRSGRIFKKLSESLEDRNAEQCRTHHQKVVLKYGSDLDKTIEKVEGCIESKKNAINDKNRRVRKRGRKKIVRQPKEGELAPQTDLRGDKNNEVKVCRKGKGIEQITIQISIDIDRIQFW